MKKLILSGLLACGMLTAQCQVLINEIQTNGMDIVEIKNHSAMMVDVSTYRLCSWPTYSIIGNLDIMSGSTTMMPGEILVVSGHSLGDTDDELGLYLNNFWTNPASMLDYVEWGSTGHTRSEVAQSAGIWANGDFTLAAPMGTTLAWDGGGNASTNWEVGAAPSFGSENPTGGDDCDGGSVSTTAGDTSVQTCTLDGSADVVMFDHETPSGENYAYIITSDANIILGLPGNSNDFDGAPQGVCRVWGVSYSGSILALVGDDLMAINISDGCYDLSENYIEIIRHDIEGATVYGGSETTLFYTCTQDGEDDVINFFNFSGSTASYSYIVTDPSGNVLGLPSGDSNNFDGAPAGTCYVYGASHTGEIIISEGENIFTDPVFSECGELSSNFLEVIRTVVDGGWVSAYEGDTVLYTCTQDGESDYIEFIYESEADDDNYTFIITSDQNEILGLPGNGNDFDEAPPGTCRVWGVSYSGNFLAMVGDDLMSITLSDECYDLSDNYIEVNRDQPAAGMVSTMSGDTAIHICTQDGIDDIVMFMNNSEALLQYSYIITDDANNVLGLPPGNENNFDIAPAGTCRVWGLSHQGEVVIQVGENIDVDLVAEGCHEVTENFIAVYRHDVTGGNVSYVGGSTEETIIIDGDPDVLEFETDSDSGESYGWIATDDQDNILTLFDGNSNDFNGAEVGTCYIYGVSYYGELNWEAGINISTVTASNCWELSENFLTVIRELADAVLEQTGVEVSVFPNPTTGLVQIQTSETILGIEVYDVAGRLAHSVTHNTLDISELPVGIYTLRIRTDTGLSMARIAKR